jgi:YVTN family beta-propeller protein
VLVRARGQAGFVVFGRREKAVDLLRRPFVASLAAVSVAVVVLTIFCAPRALATDSAELQRRLALPPFAYVAEMDIDAAALAQGENAYTGAVAYIDAAADTLAGRPAVGRSPQSVAVSPDGSKLYVTDAYDPVLHVLDADTQSEIAAVELPGVEARDPNALSAVMKGLHSVFSYELWRTCSQGVACTPDGRYVLVCSSDGLQVMDANTNKVVRTIAGLKGGHVAVSFDGKRAYVTSDDFDTLPARDFLGWFKLLSEAEDNRLVCLDLDTFEIVGEIKTAVVGGIAVKPDDSQVFISETYKKRVRVLDALTLADLWQVSTEPSYSIGLGFVPSGEKAYVVCSADSGWATAVAGQTAPRLPTAEEYFCGVIDTAAEEIVKRIPLQAY